MSKIDIYLSNTLREGRKELFTPIDTNHVKMYVCGPTVYDRPHLGNARSAVVYDLLYRLLKVVYPKVTYSRNITDVDDKIINAANSANIRIRDVATKYTKFYHEDINALYCLSPNYEPKATEHIGDMIAMIETLIERDYAYVSENHVLFSIDKYANYGALSHKLTDELIAGARVEVEQYKRNDGDFVLWKPVEEATKSNEGFESPWGYGRPGWHIECSAMSKSLLGDVFDIHGGGADLKFPHHENEIAQSCAANGTEKMANYWVHNGFLTVHGEKMSKSLNNFTTVRDILNRGIDGAVVRLFYLTTHYKKPIDFSEKALSDAQKAYNKFMKVIMKHLDAGGKFTDGFANNTPDSKALEYLADDLNTPKILALAHQVAATEDALRLHSILSLIGLGCVVIQAEQAMELRASRTFTHSGNIGKGRDVSRETSSGTKVSKAVIELAERRVVAKKAKNWQEADLLRNKIAELGYEIKDLANDEYEISKI